MAQAKTTRRKGRSPSAKRKTGTASRGRTGRNFSKNRRKADSRRSRQSISGGVRRFWGSVGEACSSAFRTVGDGVAALHDRLWCRDEAEEAPQPRKKSPGARRGQSGKERRTMAEEAENEVKSADTAEAEDNGGAGDAEEISWNQQLSSIIFGVLSLLMLALIVFPGEHFWTVLHNFIF
ncbi:MAG: hypothetical protein IIZ68_04875, partial [Clostridia bacterium]|nr:hypothetical protein [Clostridia bacterium]